jgi:hypothetical protein
VALCLPGGKKELNQRKGAPPERLQAIALLMDSKAFGEQLLASERFHFAVIHYYITNFITICILVHAGLRIKAFTRLFKIR